MEQIVTRNEGRYRKESLKSERVASGFRITIGILAISLAYATRAEITLQSQRSVYIGAACIIGYSIFLLFFTRSNLYNHTVMSYISVTFELTILTLVLLSFGEYRTFKSHVFQVYFIFLALAAYRYSQPLIIYCASASVVIYLSLFVWAVNTERIVTGALNVEYVDPVISAMGIIIKLTFLFVTSIILVLMAKGYNRVTVQVVNAERKSLQQQMKMREIRDTLTRYVTGEVADHILKSGYRLTSGRKRATVMFCDFRNFTKLSDQMQPELTVQILNKYLSALVDILFQYSGTLDKYTGDGFLAVFGVPISTGNDEYNAVAAAIEMREKVSKINKEHKDSDIPQIQIGIGINTGELIHGNIGSERRLEYTVIGTAVNLAARVEALNKTLKTSILITEATYEAVNASISVTSRGKYAIRGITESIDIYEVVRLTEEVRNFD